MNEGLANEWREWDAGKVSNIFLFGRNNTQTHCAGMRRWRAGYEKEKNRRSERKGNGKWQLYLSSCML